MAELTIEQMKANRKLWVEALRSRKYGQTKHALKNAAGRMCCLGVLSELAGVKWREDPTHNGRFLPVGHSDHTACKLASEFVGLNDPSGEFYNEDDITSLADLNDGGKRFKTIADIIESEPPGLFVESAKS